MGRLEPARHFRWLGPKTTTSTGESFPESFLPSTKKLTQDISIRSKYRSPTWNSTTSSLLICWTRTTETPSISNKTTRDTSSSRGWPAGRLIMRKMLSKFCFRGRIIKPLLSTNWIRTAQGLTPYSPSIFKSGAKLRVVRRWSCPKSTWSIWQVQKGPRKPVQKVGLWLRLSLSTNPCLFWSKLWLHWAISREITFLTGRTN